jgi:hypothetical protein
MALVTYLWVNVTNLRFCGEDGQRGRGCVLPGDVSGLLDRIAVVSGTLDRPGVRALASARVWPCEDLGSRFGQRALEVVRGKKRPVL